MKFSSRDEFDDWANALLPKTVVVISSSVDDYGVTFCLVHESKCVYPVIWSWDNFRFDDQGFVDDIMGDGALISILKPEPPNA